MAQLDALTGEWRTFDYSPYDAIVHVAGIVHQPKCKDWELYKRVNAEMPVQIAKQFKSSRGSKGLKGQYVFFSTMGVYGVGKKLKPNIIENDTPLLAVDMYGKSKLMAEEGLRQLQDEKFCVACVRPPSVYGKGCRGGYITGFKAVAQKLPIIPKAYGDVKQSFIYIDNLSEMVRLIIERRLGGVFCPQDDKAVSAIELLDAIAMGMGKKLCVSRLLGFFVRLFSFLPIINKVYGGVAYSEQLSSIEGVDYVVVPFEEGMRRTVAL